MTQEPIPSIFSPDQEPVFRFWWQGVHDERWYPSRHVFDRASAEILVKNHERWARRNERPSECKLVPVGIIS
jgi:hypothetical protein